MDNQRFDKYKGTAEKPAMLVEAFFVSVLSIFFTLFSCLSVSLRHSFRFILSISTFHSLHSSFNTTRYILTFIWLYAAMAEIGAQDWNMHWIECPGAQSDEQIWFRRTFTDCGEADCATIEVASGGHFILYVNGYNVTTDMPVHIEHHSPDTVCVTKYEVTRFLRNDTNVVAVWYSPCADNADGKRQLSLSFYGKRCDKTTDNGNKTYVDKDENSSHGSFSHVTDDSWLCRTNGCRTTPDGAETVDDRSRTPLWNTAGGENMLWQRASLASDNRHCIVKELPPTRPMYLITNIIHCTCDTIMPEGTAFLSRMPFSGQVRATLRGMKRGNIISIGTLSYICSGSTDEQAFRRFTVTSDDEIVIAGKHLKYENITNVEAMQLQPCLHIGWMY